MMKLANKGVPVKDWKPPKDYKSAIRKAKDAAKAAEDKKKGSVHSMSQSAEDTASEGDDDDFSQCGSFRMITALRRATPWCKAQAEPTCNRKIHAVNRFEGIDDTQEFSEESLKSLNQWAHQVRVISEGKTSQKKRRQKASPAQIDVEGNAHRSSQMPDPNNFDISFPPIVLTEHPIEHPILVRDEKDLKKITGMMAALPTNRKELAKKFKKIPKIKLEEDEILAMVDSGSFVHAADAEIEFPEHPIEWFSEEESNRGVAETACGGILRRLGSVTTTGKVCDVNVNIQWNHMKVKCAILSVLKLAKDGNDVWIHEDGGEIIDRLTKKRLRFFEHLGVYYMKIKIDRPKSPPPIESPLFNRRGA